MYNLNILIVEDESLLALELSTSIKNYGYNVVDYVTTISETKKDMKTKSIDLIIMDINLRDNLDGIDLYSTLNTDAFVIYLTAYKDEKTIAKAVQTEPLGYLIKPHKEGELLALLKLAEIKIQEKLTKNENTNLVSLSNEYSFNMKNEMLYHYSSFVKLSVKKLKLLKLLIEANGEVVSFQTIEEELYKENPPSESSIRTLIYRLRAELGPNMIETELNYGIKLNIK